MTVVLCFFLFVASLKTLGKPIDFTVKHFGTPENSLGSLAVWLNHTTAHHISLTKSIKIGQKRQDWKLIETSNKNDQTRSRCHWGNLHLIIGQISNIQRQRQSLWIPTH